MKLINNRTDRISQYLQPCMQECFRESCRRIQAEVDGHAGGIWEELNRAVEKCLNRAASMQGQDRKGSLGYLVFSFLRYGEYMDGPELRIDALDDGFYLDNREAAGHYRPGFLQERYTQDLDFLYRKAGEKFVRLQDYELDGIRREYTGYYHALLFRMLESLAGLVMGTVEHSGIPLADGFKIVFGEYMGNGTVLCERGVQ